MPARWWREGLTSLAVAATVALALRGIVLRAEVDRLRQSTAAVIDLRLMLEDAARGAEAAQALPAALTAISQSRDVGDAAREAAGVALTGPTELALRGVDRALRAESAARSARLGDLWTSIARVLLGVAGAACGALFALQSAWVNRRRLLAERAALEAEVRSRAHAEAELRAERSLLQAVLAHAPIGVAVFRPDGTALESNAVAQTILGQVLPPAVVDALLRKAAAGAPTPPHRWEGAGAAGEARTVELECYPGGPDALVLLCRDLTEQQAIGERLRVAEALALTGTLAAGVAHEINNPLTSVMGAAAELRRSVASASGAPEGSAELLDDLEDGLGRIRRVARELTALARPAVADAVFDPADVVARALRLHLPELAARGARVHADLPPTPGVRGDPQRFLHITTGLLANAAAALRPGGGEVRVSVAPNAAGEVVLRVEDDGVGMGPGLQARAFEPFFTTRPGGEGMGLGLFQVRAFAASMNGRVHLRSAEGQGTCVELTLPPGGAPASADAARPLQ